ncbi:hypothetical protein F4779DRAFT_597138 [Xylariaceae sp. FL0662B]|nr:hypothetical protein F4779DRAFT_597138 [Xylariaceae sp. FL0662B]
MTPTTRSHANGSTKFSAICSTYIDLKTLKSFLSHTHHQVALVANSALSELITDDSDDTSLSSIEVIEKKLPEWNQIIPKFMDSITQKSGINAKAFIILDAMTAQDKSTCFVATDSREDEYGAWPYLGFRCDFSSLVSALEALDYASVRDLRNQAAISSGAWRKQVLDTRKRQPSRIKPSNYERHQGWSTELVPTNNDTSKPYFPIFRTADVSLEILNAFLKAAYDQNWGPSDIPDPRVSFITSLSPPYGQGPAEAPLKSVPEVPAALLHASPDDCDAIARSCFPASDGGIPELNYQRFIIMDELTEREKTVIIATNNEIDGRLLLTRCDFKGAVISLIAPGATGLAMDQQIHGAADRGDGVVRGP